MYIGWRGEFIEWREVRRVRDEEGGIKRVNIGIHRHVWEENEGNRSRKGWKSGRKN